MQRSMTGGFLIEDAKLLNENARSVFDEAGHRVLGGPPLTESPDRVCLSTHTIWIWICTHGAGRLYAAKRSARAASARRTLLCTQLHFHTLDHAFTLRLCTHICSSFRTIALTTVR